MTHKSHTFDTAVYSKTELRVRSDQELILWPLFLFLWSGAAIMLYDLFRRPFSGDRAQL